MTSIAPTCGHDEADLAVRDINGVIVLSCDACAYKFMCSELTMQNFLDPFIRVVQQIDTKRRNLNIMLRRRGVLV